jgi:signal transduction histidine kinase
MTLNIGAYDFTALIPAIAEYVRRDVRPDIRMCAEVHGNADKVNCDLHLLESVLKNLLYNASRYARREIRVSFSARDGMNELLVDDDGPGIPESDRKRAFESFVQLDQTGNKKTGFGLGLAIVKRAIEWHSGEVTILQSPLGGARFCATWPTKPLAM